MIHISTSFILFCFLDFCFKIKYQLFIQSRKKKNRLLKQLSEASRKFNCSHIITQLYLSSKANNYWGCPRISTGGEQQDHDENKVESFSISHGDNMTWSSGAFCPFGLSEWILLFFSERRGRWAGSPPTPPNSSSL